MRRLWSGSRPFRHVEAGEPQATTGSKDAALKLKTQKGLRVSSPPLRFRRDPPKDGAPKLRDLGVTGEFRVPRGPAKDRRPPSPWRWPPSAQTRPSTVAVFGA